MDANDGSDNSQDHKPEEVKQETAPVPILRQLMDQAREKAEIENNAKLLEEELKIPKGHDGKPAPHATEIYKRREIRKILKIAKSPDTSFDLPKATYAEVLQLGIQRGIKPEIMKN